LEFGDTYFIGDGGSQIKVNQTAVYNGYIYAACDTNSAGIRKAWLSSPNLIDFNEWQRIRSGNYRFIQEVNNHLYKVQTNNVLFGIDENDVFTSLNTYPILPTDMVSVDNNLLVTTKDHVFVYDEGFNEIAVVNQVSTYPTVFFCATILENNKVYVGTRNIVNLGKPGFGILETQLNDVRSEERRVGKECRSWWTSSQYE